jgi:hypothetical protein
LREVEEIIGQHQVAQPEDSPHVDLARQILPFRQAFDPAPCELVAQCLAVGRAQPFHDGRQDGPRIGKQGQYPQVFVEIGGPGRAQGQSVEVGMGQAPQVVEDHGR